MGRLLALAVVAAASLLQNLPVLLQWRILFCMLGVLSAFFLIIISFVWYVRRSCVRHSLAPAYQAGLLVAARALTLLLVFVLSLAWSTWRAELRLGDRLATEHENVVSRIVFRVTGMVQDQGDSLRFQARVLSDQPVGIPREIQVVWRKPPLLSSNQTETAQTIDQIRAEEITPGQVWRAALIFRRPRGALNPHGFDFEGHMLGRNIRAIGRVRGVPTLLGDAPFDSMEVVVARARQRLRGLMRQHVKDMSFGAVLIALAIGDQDSVKA